MSLKPMLLYQTTLEELKRTSKRANSIARKGTINPTHPLSTLWSNIKMFLDSSGTDRYKTPEEVRFDMNLLGYFGKCVDEFSKDNILSNDESICAMLHEWLFYSSRIADFTTLKSKEEEAMEDITKYAKAIKQVLAKNGGGYCFISSCEDGAIKDYVYLKIDTIPTRENAEEMLDIVRKHAVKD